jgi:DNA polymerase-3 subunit epsilon
MSQVAWKEDGFDGTRLSHIAARLGFFYEAHRAVEDCHAGIEILSRTLPVTGELAMAQLLNNARKPTKRIWAIGSPFDSKDILKARGYRWNDGSDGRNKAWYLDVGFEAYEAECHFLEKEIYQREINLPITTITALERFSERA